MHYCGLACCFLCIRSCGVVAFIKSSTVGFERRIRMETIMPDANSYSGLAFHVSSDAERRTKWWIIRLLSYIRIHDGAYTHAIIKSVSCFYYIILVFFYFLSFQHRIFHPKSTDPAHIYVYRRFCGARKSKCYVNFDVRIGVAYGSAMHRSF